jgi:hypothetical protein
MLTRSLCNPRSTEPVPDVSLDAWPRRRDVRTGSQRQVRVEQIMGTAIGLDMREP